MTTLPYYSFNRVLSFNCTYNFVVGGRGLGKTYGMQKKIITDAIKRGEQFIYMRRYKDELKISKMTFFAAIKAEFPHWVFRVNGMEAQMSKADADPKDKNAWTTIGFFIPLSIAQSVKSVAFPRVTKIIFDEFIIERGNNMRYLPDEAVAFANFYNTVDRWQDKTKVFFLANSVSIMNPYFMKYKIEPDHADANGIIKKSKFMVAHFPDSKMFANEVFKTNFGKFLLETDDEYADYAVGNKFADDNDMLIKPKDPKSRYQYTLETKAGLYSVWYNILTREYTILSKRPKEEVLFTLVVEKMTEEKVYLQRNAKILQQIRTAFNQGRVTFDLPPTRNVFSEVFK